MAKIKDTENLNIKISVSLFMSRDYEKDTFAFFAERFELPHLTRQLENKYCFYLTFSGEIRYFHLDIGVRIVKFFVFNFYFALFQLFCPV